MAHITGTDRSQLLLLPERVEDYVGPDNPVRFIDAFVDQLDLFGLGFVRAEAKETGRPGYHPGDLLKLYIYGYLNRIRSSRRLEAEAHRNLEVIWLMRQLTPDFKTIADFRRENRGAFRKVFRAFVALCRDLDLFGRELIAIDGTRIKAVNSRERNFTKAKLDKALAESDERLARYLEQLDTADQDDEGGSANGSVGRLQEKIDAIRERRARLEGHRKTLEESGEEQISLTDSDSRAMHGGSGVGVGYNVQIAVDTRHKLIAEQQVHAKVNDLGLLTETASAAREVLGVERIDAVADRGYFKIEDIEAAEAAGVSPLVPKPIRGSSAANGFFTKEAFAYDPAADVYTCPGGHRLTGGRPRKVAGGARVARYTNRAACRGCPQIALHQRRLSRREPLRERGRPGSHGGPAGCAPRCPRSAPRERRAPLWLDQAVDGPGRLPDAQDRERACRVQPHGTGLQPAPRDHDPRASGPDCCSPNMKPTVSPYSPYWLGNLRHSAP